MFDFASVFDRDEGNDDARGLAIVRLGPDDGADESGHLIDAVGPFGGRRCLVVVFPAVSLGAGAAGTDHDDADISRWSALHRPLATKDKTAAPVQVAGQHVPCRWIEGDDAFAENEIERLERRGGAGDVVATIDRAERLHGGIGVGVDQHRWVIQIAPIRPLSRQRGVPRRFRWAHLPSPARYEAVAGSTDARSHASSAAAGLTHGVFSIDDNQAVRNHMTTL